jgi:DNA-binding PadR family transcriptional regulator
MSGRHKPDRPASNLELFILAMIEQGVSTPYELQSTAGISVGASIPALRRLEKHGYVRRAEASARRKQPFTITAAGSKWLKSRWKACVSGAPPLEMDGLLRVAFLAWIQADKARAVRVLKNAARARPSDSRAKENVGGFGKPGPAEFRAVQADWKQARVAAERQFLLGLARALRDR